ncbi:SCAN box domain-containing protein [Trichonephila clavipes]|nr:SCAN box domain-containing protein [Trichonephila clavipes]
MAYLAKGNKPDLFSVCEEMGVEVDQSSKVVDIKKFILNSESYVEEEVKIIIDRVISDRKERERSKQEEKEREERSKQEQNQPLNDESGRRVEIGPKIQLTQITTKFDEKHDEISLYLINFERKAELAQVPKKDWVAYLLAVLTAELSNMLVREPTERANNYDFVKDLILKSYFTEWIAELQVKTFEQLKDLLITEQLKYRVPAEDEVEKLAYQLNEEAERTERPIRSLSRIIGKLEEGRSVTSVAAEFGIAHSIVSRLWGQFQTTGTAIRGFSSGRPRGTTPADDRYIVLQARRNRRQTEGEIARHTTQATGRPISRFTVARRLHGGGLFARRPVRCVPLTPAHR